MNKKERLHLLTVLKPQIWHFYCQLEASFDREVNISEIELATRLEISLPTLSNYLTIFESHGLIQTVRGGLIITQLDGKESGVTAEPVTRRYKNARQIIEYWCHSYENYYHQPYLVSNWGKDLTLTKKLFKFSDVEIEKTIDTIMALYDQKWASPQYPRPNLGAVTSWLFQQALPFSNKPVSSSS